MHKNNTFDYLQNLALKKAVLKSKVESDSAFLGVVIGKKTIQIPVGYVYKVISNLSVTEICHTKPWLQGIAQLDGNIYSVFNLGLWTDDSIDSALIGNNAAVAFSQTNGYYAVLVEKILGIANFTPIGQPTENHLTLDYEGSNGRTVSVLSIEKLMHSNEFSNFSIFNHRNKVSK